MKKHKGSKGKKISRKESLAVLKNTAEMAAETPEELLEAKVDSKMQIELDSDLETGEISQVSSRLTDVGDRIEFDPLESAKSTDKAANTPVRDTWQQTFADENTILIKRTIRSGQSIQFDGNVVVLGDVNPGAEIIASGNIVVMGALRGVIHAGATGNEEATVAAFKLQPTQLRIANHITRAPDGEYMAPNHPEIARIRDGVVVIELYQMSQDRQIKIC